MPRKPVIASAIEKIPTIWLISVIFTAGGFVWEVSSHSKKLDALETSVSDLKTDQAVMKTEIHQMHDIIVPQRNTADNAATQHID